jgi:hypothetical protein
MNDSCGEGNDGAEYLPQSNGAGQLWREWSALANSVPHQSESLQI